MLLFLDGEYAKRKLEEEKEYVKQGNLGEFHYTWILTCIYVALA